MKRSFFGCLFVLQAYLLGGCSSVNVEVYKNEIPKLKLEEYLNGTLVAHGIFQNRKGLITKRFTVEISGSWKGPDGTLDEKFTYSDGTKSQRTWHLKKTSDSTYSGTASDVIGTAIGTVAGNALHWAYILAVESEGKTYHVNFDDWMYLMNDEVMLNKSAMSKWGFHLGEVTLSFYKNKK